MAQRLATIEDLPVELFNTIIDHIVADTDSNEYTPVILALSRAIPYAPIPIQYLFHDIHIKKPGQVLRLYQRLRKSPQYASYIQKFSLETWAVDDADIVVNLIALVSNVRRMSLFIGPNFAPEHLEEMFATSRETLDFLSIRFRPYVQKATYYQFLKGAYFDSTLEALAKWPIAKLVNLSIIQDPLDSSISPKGNFAQPLVFHRLDPITTLSISTNGTRPTHIRFRIPARQIGRFLYSNPRSFPMVQLLDLSTSYIGGSELEAILARFDHLIYLVLDGCPIVSQRVDALEVEGAEALSEWLALGRTMALAGLRRARDREKKVKAWLELIYSRAKNKEPEQQSTASRSRAKKGRRGLATATISLRASPPKDDVSLPDLSGLSLEELNLPPKGPPRIRILPPEPRLRFFATTAPMMLGPGWKDRYSLVQTEFEKGWAAGIATLAAKRAFLRTSHSNGIRVMRYVPRDDSPGQVGEEGLAYLEDIPREENSAYDIPPEGQTCPVLCLAGPEKGDHHAEGCAHEKSWEIWNDGI